MTIPVIALLFLALFAGWIDAIIGGGGLIQVPAILILYPDATPAQAVATSKIAAILGTAYAISQFGRQKQLLNPKRSITFGLITALGGAVGAAVLTVTPEQVFAPLLLVALIAIVTVLSLKPNSLYRDHSRELGASNTLTIIASATLIGMYDGFVGPGTGTILVIALGALMGWSLTAATANAKIVNCLTYLGPLIVLGINGSILWGLGLAMGIMNVIGAHFGVKFALSRGTAGIRWVLFVTVALLAIRMFVKLIFGI